MFSVPLLNATILDAHPWHGAFDFTTLTARLQDGTAYLAYNGNFSDRGLTLIEYLASNRFPRHP